MRVIRIGGTAYSGSTMLDLVLGSAKNAFSCGEINALFRPYKAHHLSPRCSCSSEGCDLWISIRRSGEKCLYHSLCKLLGENYTIIDSSKDPSWIYDQNRITKNQNINVTNILLWKTPDEFATSMYKRGKEKKWEKSYVNYYIRYFCLVDKWIAVSYRQLTEETKVTLKKLCSETGLEYSENIDQYWKKERHIAFGSNVAKIHLYAPGSKQFEETNIDRKRHKNNQKEDDREIRNHQGIYKNTVSEIKNESRILDEIETILKLSAYDFEGALPHIKLLRRKYWIRVILWYRFHKIIRKLRGILIKMAANE